MAFPRGDQYQAAVQNPRSAFLDPDLQASRPETAMFGMPKVNGGSFALTYHLAGPGGEWAVRCFKRAIPAVERRYAALTDYCAVYGHEVFVPTAYQPNGIRVDGSWHPLVKMAWVAGQPLNLFIESNIGNRAALRDLPTTFLRLVERMEALGVAHGDLQHGNILVRGGDLVLVDYDGVYLPALAGCASADMGHVNYQHPGRREDEFGPHLDRFPSIVIYLALRGAVANPRLRARYSDGENLLFTQEDFRSPGSSPLLAELERLPDLRDLVARFRSICQVEPRAVPPLSVILRGEAAAAGVGQGFRAGARRRLYAVLSTDELEAMRSRLGERVEVVGRITDTYRGKTVRDEPYVFFNLGDWRGGCFYLIAWSDTLCLFERARRSPASYIGSWVSVTGVLEAYRGRPQMVLRMPSEINILADERAARQRLGTADDEVDGGSGDGHYPRSRLPQPVLPGASSVPTASPDTPTARLPPALYKGDVVLHPFYGEGIVLYYRSAALGAHVAVLFNGHELPKGLDPHRPRPSAWFAEPRPRLFHGSRCIPEVRPRILRQARTSSGDCTETGWHLPHSPSCSERHSPLRRHR